MFLMKMYMQREYTQCCDTCTDILYIPVLDTAATQTQHHLAAPAQTTRRHSSMSNPGNLHPPVWHPICGCIPPKRPLQGEVRATNGRDIPRPRMESSLLNDLKSPILRWCEAVSWTLSGKSISLESSSKTHLRLGVTQHDGHASSSISEIARQVSRGGTGDPIKVHTLQRMR